MKCYYAHAISSYNTDEEVEDILALERLGFEVLNPNNPEYDAAYKQRGMEVFLELVDSCDCLVFRAFDDERATIPAGVWKEIGRAESAGKLVLEIPGAIGDRQCSVEETRRKLTMRGRA